MLFDDVSVWFNCELADFWQILQGPRAANDPHSICTVRTRQLYKRISFTIPEERSSIAGSWKLEWTVLVTKNEKRG